MVTDDGYAAEERNAISLPGYPGLPREMVCHHLSVVVMLSLHTFQLFLGERPDLCGVVSQLACAIN